MDRRNFIKTSTIGAGFLMVNPSLAFAEQHSKTTLSTNLDIKGYVKEPRRDIPVIDAADVVILGGGPAGVAAAVSAARTGAEACGRVVVCCPLLIRMDVRRTARGVNVFMDLRKN